MHIFCIGVLQLPISFYGMSIFVLKVIEIIIALQTDRKFSLPLPFTKLHVKLSVADPDSGSGAFLTPGSGIQDEQPGSYFLELKKTFFGLKYFNSLLWIRDPEWKKFGSWMEKIRIRDEHPGSAALVKLSIQTLAILFWIQRSSASFFSARLPLNAALQIRNDYLK
jgi:hypothetical protein